MGTWIYCDGTDHKGCPTNQRRYTAIIVIGHNRSFAAAEQWGRGIRLGYKRRDLCPGCMAKERELHKDAEAAKEARKRDRDEARKAKLSSEPRTRKPRKKADASATAPPSPSEASAPAPAT